MTARSGVVYLVGAGPGDPGLLTARALELIAAADVILHGRLIPPAALSGAGPDAEHLYVGKEPGDSSVPQEKIEQLLIDRARAGSSVVRLKGGDPFTFGRGGEEAEALAEADIPFEVVPGVTAGIAAPAYAGIPVTHRDDSSALVFYMGVKRLPEISSRLIEAGRPADEPAAVIERGTLPDQRSVEAPLSAIAQTSIEAEIRPPAVTVVGPVAARRQSISWLESRPLHGLRVVVTRARAQASGLARTLAALGAEPVELPTIRIEPAIDTDEVRRAVHDLHTYALICLTSANGVRLLFEAMTEQGRDARALANSTVAAIGPGTAAALAERGVIADIVPERFIAEALADALADVSLEGKPALVARAAEGREVLPDALRERGAEVDVVALYETVTETPDPGAVERAREADYLTFTSSSTVRNLVATVGADAMPSARVVSIGPVTTEAAREAGLEVDVEAERHDVEGLIEAILADAEGRG